MKAGIHFFLLLVGFFVYGSLNAQSAAPNIIFILADDMGYGDVSALNKNSKINTPALDELIKQGMNFTDAHSASSVCTPSRYAVLTGRYAWRSPLKQGVLQPYDPPLIENNRLTVAAMLQQKGYATACIGKWHLGWNWPLVTGATFADSLQQGNNNAKRRGAIESYINYTAPVKDGPLTKGFSYFFGVDVPNFPPYIFIENDRIQGTPSVKKPDSMFGIAGNMQTGWSLENILPNPCAKNHRHT